MKIFRKSLSVLLAVFLIALPLLFIQKRILRKILQKQHIRLLHKQQNTLNRQPLKNRVLIRTVTTIQKMMWLFIFTHSVNFLRILSLKIRQNHLVGPAAPLRIIIPEEQSAATGSETTKAFSPKAKTISNVILILKVNHREAQRE